VSVNKKNIKEYWKDYELIDCGDKEKLERFGRFILRRPEPQALWKKELQEKDWGKICNAHFVQTESHQGKWDFFDHIQNPWNINYKIDQKHLIKFKLNFTRFKHIGIFPEQAHNWDIIFRYLTKIENAKTLNLFAYTGGASLSAKAAGSDVVHVDSVKQVISWAAENMQLSKLDNIRWVIEDALKFVKREAKRKNAYHLIILDPPAYGIGSKGERWKLEDSLFEIMSNVSEILKPNGLVILNTYSLGLSTMVCENIFQQVFQESKPHSSELYFISKTGLKLPLGASTYNKIIKS
tara:strand:+ start:4596 stop:5477 length:882 start_codon:yes stop_codon:yes gene_type:complete